MPPLKKKGGTRKPEPLDYGDEIEYSLTTHVEYRDGGSISAFWPRVGVRSTVRAGETAEGAMQRIATFVEDRLDEKVTAIV